MDRDFLEEAEKEKKELEDSMIESFRQRDERIAKEKKKKGSCGCGRSPTGLCIGWHSLTEDQYKEKKIEWEKMNDKQKEAIFHPKAIDGIGD
jgi:3-deoxy-D-arabino-heptulosonate 7-phosphate (DAHP) synthase|tara:strand:- start:311 stop:586 length:276 start_codon:yes stop_codon:yes gene_type:complete